MSIVSALVTWVGTCDGIQGPHATAKDLVDGVALSEVFAQIAPDQIKLNLIKRDVADNPHLRVANLRKLLNGIRSFFEEELAINIQQSDMPDVALIGENEDLHELSKLIVLLIGSAVQCTGKEPFVQAILQMSMEEQAVIMQAIQELVSRGRARTSSAGSELRQPGHSGDDDSVDALKARLRQLEAAKNDFENLYQDSSRQLRQVQGDLDDVIAERERLKSLLDDADSPIPGTPAGKAQAALRGEVNNLREQLDQIEGLRDQYKLQAEEQQKTIVDLRHKVDSLAKDAADSKTMREEFEVLQHSAAKVTKLEASVENYKKKLEDMNDLKQRLKDADDRNNSFMQQQLDLEDERAKYNAIKGQMERYRESTVALQAQLNEAQLQMQKAALEATQFREESKAKASEIEQLKHKLSETEDQLSMGGGASLGASLAASAGSSSLADSFNAMTPDLRERLARLERENAKLKASLAGGDSGAGEGQGESSKMLQALLDDANEARGKLEREILDQQQKLMRLEGDKTQLQTRFDDLQKQQVRSGAESIAWQQLAESERATSKFRQENEELQGKLDDSQRTYGIVKDELESAQKELVELKKQQALLSMDKQEMVSEMNTRFAQESEAKLQAAVAPLQTERDELSAKLQALQASFDPMSNALESLQVKHDNLVTVREQLEHRGKEQLERINAVLTEKAELQSKYLDVQEKFITLQSEVSDSKDVMRKLEGELTSKGHHASNAGEIADLRKQLDEERARSYKLEGGFNTLKEERDAVETKLTDANGQLEGARTKLTQKALEVEKHQTWLNEAKTVIKKEREKVASLEAQLQSGQGQAGGESDSQALGDMQKRLAAKDSEVSALKIKMAGAQDDFVRQQRLTTSAFHSIVLKLQQSTVSERFQAKSFLARQRANITGRLGDS
ncbi:hypothetical protein CAOG_05617 [Capsaspora owczarzaki ATCC 30864]|uniref:Calponin-homology (CH) domain-containing protein n=1 Tax=Capsaspora owczarzaki (strain ATCC 30864) TaxID=595528 RepID=A0A0D2X3Y8_CAPO3|nr:hypothetical protein CAOG_05617 [Capsaspora owczarzaki ATCC 30864]KJE95134.1 hypothetical protein CAOG_005617 [Capsaspora owczarzaki ATCC 30864]|eukprot:XP_004346290.2 hypothetical protein CAOG_05617 [Capsaspora owczarzaki ATCC 30864]